jgi:hydroxypyruvate reductase
MIEMVSQLTSDDLCIALISGGGSALLPAPIAGISIADKIAVANELAAAGANITQLNVVRRAVSQVKGGGLARACRAGKMLSLVISDVPGDRLDTVASGPTWESHASPCDALQVLHELDLLDHPRLTQVVQVLRARLRGVSPGEASHPGVAQRPTVPVDHVILANNAVAVDAAGVMAERLGYNHAMTSATQPEGTAEDVGRHLASMALQMRAAGNPNCLITGGEPTVKLPPADRRGRGGRNQQLVLAALQQLGDCRDIALASGGTDGEDGPTDAAGAIVDESAVADSQTLRLDIAMHLARCDAYHFFAPLGALIKTGPTHTNVCDLRVITVGRT